MFCKSDFYVKGNSTIMSVDSKSNPLVYLSVAPIIGSVIGLTIYRHNILDIGIGSDRPFESKPIR